MTNSPGLDVMTCGDPITYRLGMFIVPAFQHSIKNDLHKISSFKFSFMAKIRTDERMR